jgi:hypothetical protein
MKNIQYIFLVLLFASCDFDKDLEISQLVEKKLVVNGIAENNKSLIISVAPSRAMDSNFVDELNSNDIVVKLFKEETFNQDLLYVETKSGVHYFKTKDSVEVGKKYSLEVQAKNFPTTKSSIIKLESAPVCSIDNIVSVELNGSSNNYIFDLNFADSTVSVMNYLISMNVDVFKDGIVTNKKVEGLLYTEKMPVVVPKPVDEDWAKYLNDKSYKTTLLFYKDENVNKNYYNLKSGFCLSNVDADSLFLNVEFSTITAEYYDYVEHIYSLNTNLYYYTDFYFNSNPVNLSSSFDNAYGVFGGSSFKVNRIKLPN